MHAVKTSERAHEAWGALPVQQSANWFANMAWKLF